MPDNIRYCSGTKPNVTSTGFMRVVFRSNKDSRVQGGARCLVECTNNSSKNYLHWAAFHFCYSSKPQSFYSDGLAWPTGGGRGWGPRERLCWGGWVRIISFFTEFWARTTSVSQTFCDEWEQDLFCQLLVQEWYLFHFWQCVKTKNVWMWIFFCIIINVWSTT